MVRLGHEELLARGVRLRLAVLGPEEEGRHAQAGHDGQHLGRARQGLGEEEHLRERRVERELGHLPAQLGQPPPIIERPEHPELVHAVQNVLLGRRVHEREVQQVLDAERLEQQDHITQVRPLDLGHLRLQQLVPELPLRVQAITKARPRPARAARALARVRARHRRHVQRVHAHARVVDLELAVPTIHNIFNAVDGQRRLRDVRGDDALPLVLLGTLKNLRLEVRRQLRVHGE